MRSEPVCVKKKLFLKQNIKHVYIYDNLSFGCILTLYLNKRTNINMYYLF